MDQIASAALQACLRRDYDSARQALLGLEPTALRELQQAAMALQNLTAARRYAIAQQQLAIVKKLQEAKMANR
ncbi:MAG: hypothetical protein GX093_11660 [Xanthomonadaceae bacterium]|nr:hypothetical protein [Xanthomonadaceae bacterium]